MSDACTCAQIVNSFGSVNWKNGTCPVHGLDAQKQDDDQAAQLLKLELERRHCQICKEPIRNSWCACTL